ncbi:hypothetical protein C1H46_011843 [Malus baccata]|uniref:Uncharacterized protein n=1 Tax=Malus baccata TaxID=106549 RepID=A0A540MUR2_MALBA|nr:hypothetical protein C1H46_011843 [Malus baccata]
MRGLPPWLSSRDSKLDKKRYDYATLAECFDVLDDLTDWDDRTRKIFLQTSKTRFTSTEQNPSLTIWPRNGRMSIAPSTNALVIPLEPAAC